MEHRARSNVQCALTLCVLEKEREKEGKEGSEVKELSQPGTQQAGLARRGEQTKSRARALSLETFSLSLSIDLPTFILKKKKLKNRQRTENIS